MLDDTTDETADDMSDEVAGAEPAPAAEPAPGEGEADADAAPEGEGDGDVHEPRDDEDVVFERSASVTEYEPAAGLATRSVVPSRATRTAATVATWIGVPLLSATLAAIAAFGAVTYTLPFTIDRYAQSIAAAQLEEGRCRAPGVTDTRIEHRAYDECQAARNSERHLIAAGARSAQVDVKFIDGHDLTGPDQVARVRARATFARPQDVDQEALRVALAVMNGTTTEEVRLRLEPPRPG